MNKRGGGTYELFGNAGNSDRGRGRHDLPHMFDSCQAPALFLCNSTNSKMLSPRAGDHFWVSL